MARALRSAFSFLTAILLLLLSQVQTPAAEDQGRSGSVSPVDACLARAGGLGLGAPLTFARAKLHASRSLTIVALGSSSTSGFGLFGNGAAFPDVMKQELSRLWPQARIEVINSGRIMENIADNVARLDSDVLRYNPDLVIWQIGTNDVVWRGIAANSKEMLAGSIRRMRAAKADVILLDLQYAPFVLVTNRYAQMEQIIAGVANQEKVGLFPRFLMMKRAIDAGVTGLVSWDGLHNSANGYACVGIALARMINGAIR